MSTYNRVRSKLERAKSLRNIITWKEDEKLKNPNDVVDVKENLEFDPVKSIPQEVSPEEVSMNMVLQKECAMLQSKLNDSMLAVKDLEADQASIIAIKDQFALELEKTKSELSTLQEQLALCQNEKSAAELSSFAAKKEIERLCAEVGTMKQEKLKTDTEIEQLTIEIGIMKGNYQKLEVMFSDTSRHEKIQYENTAKTREELERVTEELATVAKENSVSKAMKLELEEQVSQLEEKLDKARVKFEEMAHSAQEEISKANKMVEDLEESRMEDSRKLERKSTEVDSLLKDSDAMQRTFEEEKKQLALEHKSNLKSLEDGFLTTLQARDEELEKYKIVSNKYKKKNESLSKDIRNLLTKLENQQLAPSAHSPMRPPISLNTNTGSAESGTPSLVDNDSSFTLVVSSSSTWTGTKLKDSLERANSWVKKIKRKKKSSEPKPSRPEQLRQRRCADIEKLNRSQLVAKCLTLQLENGDLTLQIQSFHEQVRNLKFASAYLANRLSTFERAARPQPAEDIQNSDGSSLADMRALLLADEDEEKEQGLSIIKPSKEELGKPENCQEDEKEEIVIKPAPPSTPLPERKEDALEEAGARLPVSKNIFENEEPWVDVAAGDESTSAGQKNLSPAEDPSIELNFEEWLES